MFSFIIPVFNDEIYIKQCVSSILSLSVEKEIIIVDDGSTDQSSSVCAELVRRNDCVRYFTKENGGAASARNRGIREATGKYIVFVDSDDFLDEKWDSAVLSVINNGADLFVYGMSFDYYDNNNNIARTVEECRFNGLISKEQIISHFQEYLSGNAFSSACNKVFKSEIIKNSIVFNEEMNFYEDLDFVIKYLCKTDYVCFIPDMLYHYRFKRNENKYKTRLSDIEEVSHNLDFLSNSISLFSQEATVEKSRSDLYMDILMANIMMNRYSGKELSEILPDYLNNRRITQELLSQSHQKLYFQIKNGNFKYLYFLFEYRKSVAKAKKTIKRIIGK